MPFTPEDIAFIASQRRSAEAFKLVQDDLTQRCTRTYHEYNITERAAVSEYSKSLTDRLLDAEEHKRWPVEVQRQEFSSSRLMQLFVRQYRGCRWIVEEYDKYVAISHGQLRYSPGEHLAHLRDGR